MSLTRLVCMEIDEKMCRETLFFQRAEKHSRGDTIEFAKNREIYQY